jgi:hypothetical protein
VISRIARITVTDFPRARLSAAVQAKTTRIPSFSVRVTSIINSVPLESR